MEEHVQLTPFQCCSTVTGFFIAGRMALWTPAASWWPAFPATDAAHYPVSRRVMGHGLRYGEVKATALAIDDVQSRQQRMPLWKTVKQGQMAAQGCHYPAKPF